MTIKEYLDKEKLNVKEFAYLLGVSTGIARLWLCGAVSPRLMHAHLIYSMSKGKVKMRDMLSTVDKQALEGAGL